MNALVLTYHAVEEGPAPLCLDAATFEQHLDAIAETEATTLTVAELATGLRRRSLPDRSVALTFDDAFATAVEVAAPMLLERGMRATFFCVAGHIGGLNDWPTQGSHAPRLPLADADALFTAAASGFEIGSHGMTHAPLDALTDELAEYEVVGSKEALETALDAHVSSFAYPYGAERRVDGGTLVSAYYTAACTTRLGPVARSSSPLALPRVDAHYLRQPALMRRALCGSLGPYLSVRRFGARARRMVVKDYRR